MDADLAERARDAAAAARRCAAGFPGSIAGDALPWKVVEAYDAQVRGTIARDPRIEDERDRVLVTAVKLAASHADDEAEIEAARARLVDAIDYLEQAVLRFGIPDRAGSRRRG